MDPFESFTIEQEESWRDLNPRKGDVLEAWMGSATTEDASETWMGFLVLGTDLHADGSAYVRCRVLYGEDMYLYTKLAPLFEEKEGVIHLCKEYPCGSHIRGEPGVGLHVIALRLWKYNDYVEYYNLVEQMEEKVRAWLNGPRKSPRAKAEPAAKKEAASKSKAKSSARPGALRKETSQPGKRAPRRQSDEDKRRKGEAALSKLREKLAGKKAELAKIGPSGEAIEVNTDDESCQEVWAEDETSQFALAELKKERAPKEVKAEALSLRPADLIGTLQKTRKRKDSEGKDMEEDTSGITMKGPKGDLLRRAFAATRKQRERQKAKKDKKQAKGGSIGTVLKALAKVADGANAKKKKKEKKDADTKAMKKMKKQLGLKSSSETSSEETDSEEDKKESSEEEIEAPVRKKSQKSPGSILEMLTNHVREQLDQTAATELNGEDTSVTSGVKIMTFFTLHVKPMFGSHQKEMREMFHLASTMDALRQGNIAKVGDALAARWMAIHQSLYDSNWHTARHMELFSMDDQSASTTGMLLATRRHSKMIAKMQNSNPASSWNAQGKGRGRGGKGDWNYSPDKGGGKGKGKDKKGKGKERNTWNQGQDWTNTDWKDKKDPPGDKKSWATNPRWPRPCEIIQWEQLWHRALRN